MKQRDPSWLMERKPPYGDKPAAERALWWATIRMAAHDLRFGPETQALDALEFLRSTGVWLCNSLFWIPEEETKREIVDIVLRRNRAFGTSLPVGAHAHP